MKVFAGISHKGGTGRSVTLANAAYHLTLLNKTVCLVDLDITSPTLGSVLGIGNCEMGAPPGSAAYPMSVVDLLSRKHDLGTAVGSMYKALIDIWSNAPALQSVAPPGRPKFQLLPGCANVDESALDYDRLGSILQHLSVWFDVTLLDVRSGNSVVSDALTREPSFDFIRCWLLHYRWTHQHLAGVENFADRFYPPSSGKFVNRVKTIRTAVPRAEGSGPRRRMIDAWDEELRFKLRQLPPQLKEIGAVPFEEMLLWHETVVTPTHLKDGLAEDSTYRSYSSIAEAISGMLENPDV